MNTYNVQYLFGATSNLLQVHQTNVLSTQVSEGQVFRMIDDAGGFHSPTDDKWIAPSAILDIKKL